MPDYNLNPTVMRAEGANGGWILISSKGNNIGGVTAASSTAGSQAESEPNDGFSMATAGDMGLSKARSGNHVPYSIKTMGHGIDGGSVMGSIVGYSASASETSRFVAGASINTPNIGNSALIIEELDCGGQDALNTCENSFFGPHLGLGRQKNVIRLGQTPDVELLFVF